MNPTSNETRTTLPGPHATSEPASFDPEPAAARWLAWLRDHGEAIALARGEVAREFSWSRPRDGRCVVAVVDDGAIVAVGTGSAADTWRAWVESWDPVTLVDVVDDTPADPAAWVREYFSGFTILWVQGSDRALAGLGRGHRQVGAR